MKCLVTGATGFVGTNLVHELVKAGWEVRASGMHGDDTKYIAHLPIEVKMADITITDVDSCINDALVWYRDNGYDI